MITVFSVGLKHQLISLPTIIRWCGGELGRDDDSVLRVALDLGVRSNTTKKDLEEANGRGNREDW